MAGFEVSWRENLKFLNLPTLIFCSFLDNMYIIVNEICFWKEKWGSPTIWESKLRFNYVAELKSRCCATWRSRIGIYQCFEVMYTSQERSVMGTVRRTTRGIHAEMLTRISKANESTSDHFVLITQRGSATCTFAAFCGITWITRLLFGISLREERRPVLCIIQFREVSRR